MFEFNTVEEAIKDLKEGKIIIVTDDDDRVLWMSILQQTWNLCWIKWRKAWSTGKRLSAISIRIWTKQF